MNSKKKLLLSSVTRPFGEKYGDGFTVQSILSKQNLWAQDIYLTEAHATHWGLDLIAENMNIPAKVLHYPSLAEFTREIKKGYSHIGLSFIPQTLHKLRPMLKMIKKHAPDSKIILGGFGTMLDPVEFNMDHDYVCKGEGISFMRSLFHEKEKEFSHPMITLSGKLLSLPVLGGTAMIFAGLGCPNGCEFCTSSHYFGRKHIPYLKTGKSIVEVILKYKKHDPKINHYAIYDDDFLLDRKRGKSLAEEVKKLDFVPQFTVFSSVKAVSQYNFQELAEMGINTIWMGFEGMQARYHKMEGKSFQEIIEGCREYGIHVITSMIIGFDYQKLDTIDRELNALLKLKPMCSQFLIYGPGWVTPLRNKLEKEGRLVGHYHTDFSHQDGFELLFKHPHISKPDMEKKLRECYRKEYDVLGPSAFRVLENTLIGYKNQKNTTNTKLQYRNKEFKELLKQGFLLYFTGRVFAPNQLVKNRVKVLFSQIRDQIGPPPVHMYILSLLALVPALITKLRFRFYIGMQPPLTVNDYRLDRD